MMHKRYLKEKLFTGYIACGSVFATSAFVINNWMLLMHRDYYYYHTNMTATNIASIFFCHFPMITKSLLIGATWPIILSDFVYYDDENSQYKAFRHITPWLSYDNKIVKENDKRKYIDVSESLTQYGVKGFYYEWKCVKK